MNFSHIVIIGSSSGGIEALSRLVQTLPTEFSAPIIVAQHLDPRRPSSLESILSRHSSLRVTSVEHHVELEPGVIYVVPSNQMVEFTDSEISLKQNSLDRPLPSIDRLLTTAAATYGERLIAVILTGSGTDGTSGAHAVKSADGTVIIQDPQSAEYPSMPRSLAPTSVDFVRDLDEIGELLDQLVAMPVSAITVHRDAEKSLEEFLSHLRTQCNIDFSQYKTPTILRRLQRRMAATNTTSLDEYFEHLNQHPDEYHHLVSSFLIKVTEFFRDWELFEYIKESILPELIEDGRVHGNQLRIWSAGCATGEEAYSLAILVAEALGEETGQFNIRIFATDLDIRAVSFARRGVYSGAALGQLPEEWVERYFISLDGDYEIRKNIRTMAVFGQHDLAQRSPFPAIDLILCRNVLIYFTPDLQRRALQLFAYSLRREGYLILGKSESTSQLGDYFSTRENTLKVFKRQGDRVPIPVGPIDTTIFAGPANQPSRVWHQQSSVEVHRAHREVQRAKSSHERTENVLFNLPVGVVLVDQHYDIRMINNIGRQFLGIHGAAVGEDLLHLVQTMPLEPIRDGIDGALRSDGEIKVPGEWPVELLDGEHLIVEISCQRQSFGYEGDSGHAVVVVITDITEPVVERRRVTEERERDSQENRQLGDRVAQLLRTNQQLIDANRDLAVANEELRTTNEELLVSSEEAQASSEEIETLNEELQTTNEELETLNEELQATVEELNATNEDMQARTIELQEERRYSEKERARLEAILVSMGDAVVVVDSQGTITLMNDACREMFGEGLSKLVPEAENGEPIPEEQSPLQLARSGETFTMPFTTVGADGNRCWFEANGRPIRDDLGSSGTVVVIRDITDRSLRRLQEEFMSIASHELRSPLTALRGYLEMMQQHVSSNDERSQRYVSIALAMVHRLVDLVSDLLDVGRLQSGKFMLSIESVDLIELTRRTAELTQSMASEHSIEVDVPSDPIDVQADPMRLQQVLLNLLSNAIDYSPGKDRIDLRLRRDRDHAEIAIQDYGIGIEREALSQVFSRFYQIESGPELPQRGLGLGLYIAHEIVAAHGGEISVESTPGEGTTFTVRLPLASAWS